MHVYNCKTIQLGTHIILCFNFRLAILSIYTVRNNVNFILVSIKTVHQKHISTIYLDSYTLLFMPTNSYIDNRIFRDYFIEALFNATNLSIVVSYELSLLC